MENFSELCEIKDKGDKNNSYNDYNDIKITLDNILGQGQGQGQAHIMAPNRSHIINCCDMVP